jgi:hypothetical protein
MMDAIMTVSYYFVKNIKQKQNSLNLHDFIYLLMYDYDYD